MWQAPVASQQITSLMIDAMRSGLTWAGEPPPTPAVAGPDGDVGHFEPLMALNIKWIRGPDPSNSSLILRISSKMRRFSSLSKAYLRSISLFGGKPTSG